MTRDQVVDMLMNASSQDEIENAYEAMMDFFAEDGFDPMLYRASERIAVIAYHKGWEIGPGVEVDEATADIQLASGAPLRMAKAYTRIKWEATKHPRDHEGKFRETPDMPIANPRQGLRPLLGPVESRNTTAGGAVPPPTPMAGGSEGGGPPTILKGSPGVKAHALEIAQERAARHGITLKGKTWEAVKKEIPKLPKIVKRDMRPESIEKIATLQHQAYNRYAAAVNAIAANHSADVPRWVDFYPSARERMQEVADQFGVPPRVAIAMAAVASPERRWPENKESETPYDNVGIVVEMLKDWVEYGELGAPERDSKGEFVLNDKGQPNLTKHYGAKSLRALLDRVQPILDTGSAFGNMKPEDLRRPPVSGDRVKSRKIRNFFANIMGDQGSVTIDRMMARLAYDVEGPGPQSFPLPDLVRDPQAPSDDEYTAMENATRKIAAQTGWSPAATQAILWGYAREVMTPPINNYRKTKEGAAHYASTSKRPKSTKLSEDEFVDESFQALSPNDLLAALAVADNETALQILIDQMSEGQAGAYSLSEEENVLKLSEMVGLGFDAARAARVALRMKEWVESQHPRDTEGKFRDKPNALLPPGEINQPGKMDPTGKISERGRTRTLNKFDLLPGLMPIDEPEEDKGPQPIKKDRRLFDPDNPPVVEDSLYKIRQFIKDASEQELRDAAAALDDSILKDILLEAADKKYIPPPPPVVKTQLQRDIEDIMGPFGDATLPWPGMVGETDVYTPTQAELADTHDWLYGDRDDKPALKLWEDMRQVEKDAILRAYVNRQQETGQLPEGIPEGFNGYVEPYGDYKPAEERPISISEVMSEVRSWDTKFGSNWYRVFEGGGPEYLKDRYWSYADPKKQQTSYRAAVRSAVKRAFGDRRQSVAAGRFSKVKVSFDKDDNVISITGIAAPEREVGIIYRARAASNQELVRMLNERMELVGERVWMAMLEHPEAKGLFDGSWGGNSPMTDEEKAGEARISELTLEIETFEKSVNLAYDRTMESYRAEREFRYSPTKVIPRPTYTRETTDEEIAKMIEVWEGQIRAKREELATQSRLAKEDLDALGRRMKQLTEERTALRARTGTPHDRFFTKLKKVYMDVMEEAGQKMGMTFPLKDGSSKEMSAKVLAAAELLPAAWSFDDRPLSVIGPVSRGFHNIAGREIALSSGAGGNSGGYFGVAIHEMGHLIDGAHGHNDLMSLDYLMWRTNGMENRDVLAMWEETKHLHKEYGDKDEFFSAYVGKDYGSLASEVMSQGMEYFFFPRVSESTPYGITPSEIYTTSSDNIYSDLRHRNYLLGRMATARGEKMKA